MHKRFTAYHPAGSGSVVIFKLVLFGYQGCTIAAAQYSKQVFFLVIIVYTSQVRYNSPFPLVTLGFKNVVGILEVAVGHPFIGKILCIGIGTFPQIMLINITCNGSKMMFTQRFIIRK